MSVDAARGIVYVPTGSGKYNFFGGYRRGDNLFSDSLLALDARTGKRLWHFQTVHHDIWDLDNNSAPQLTTITHDGRKSGRRRDGQRRPATCTSSIASAASRSGRSKSVRCRRGPRFPGSTSSPTQPIPTKPEPFSRQSFTVDDLNPHLLTDEQRAQFRERILKARNDGPFTPIGFDEVVHMPGNQGGSNWGSTAGNPGDGRVYVIGFNVPTIIRLLKPGETRPARAGGNAEEIVKDGLSDDRRIRPLPDDRQAALHDAHRLRSRTPARSRGRRGSATICVCCRSGSPARDRPSTVKGGLIVTGTGLLFATAADRKVHVYDTSTGRELATLPLGGPTSGGPSMYEHGGRQYLLVTASAVQPSGPGAVPTPHTGPTGLIAYALPR